MSKTIIVYESKYGSTKQYAQWIKEELNCDITSLSNIKAYNLDDYDKILFGGGVHAGGISGWDKFRKLIKKYMKNKDDYNPPKKIAVFACGINIQSFDTRSQLRNVNFDKEWLRGMTCFFLDGAYNPEHIKGVDKVIMKVMRKFLVDKGLNRSKDENQLLKIVDEGCDMVNRDNIKAIVEAFS